MIPFEEDLRYDYNDFDIKDLVGKTFNRVYRSKDGGLHEDKEGNELCFLNDEILVFLYHEQDCCESVTIDDVCGDLADLEISPILFAEESTNITVKHEHDDSVTWTFYKFATVNGWVDVRWYGTSNGYYSESVNVKSVSQIRDTEDTELE
jgi:hypothetical protein